MGTYDELIAARMGLDELRAHVGCDTLAFLSVEGMLDAIGRREGYCTACFTGEYAIDTSALRRRPPDRERADRERADRERVG